MKMITQTLTEAKRLHGLGFAILWLKPKSKMPIESKWTTGPKHPWEYLKTTYIDTLNVGVRTGTASKIGDGYLACIDVDIKDPGALGEADLILVGLLKGKKLPEVRSGSGGGSRHYYCRTPEPFKMITIEKNERFEICVYSDGRQMVMPPSIHPKTGKMYTWKTHVKVAGDLPLMDFSGVPTKPAKVLSNSTPQGDVEPWQVHDYDGPNEFKIETPMPEFRPVPVELPWVGLNDSIIEGITNGTGVTDRSEYLLTAARALISAGLSTVEILSVLTDRSTYIGKCAFDHAQSSDRGRAATWVWKYTLRKLVEERSVVGIFKDASEYEKPTRLEGEALSSQTADILADAITAKDRGFHFTSAKGALSPDYQGLLDYFKDKNPYKSIADMKTVYIFNGTHYEDISPIEVKAFAEKNFSPRPLDKIRNEFWNKVLVNNVARRIFFIDTTEGKINFNNGYLDLNGSEGLRPHTPNIGFRGVLPYNFDPNADCPLFKKWLKDIMQSDKELVSILQEYMGYIVRGGDYRYHKALWLGGTGRNGKSTFIDILKALIGPRNYSTISIKALVNDKFAGSDLDGKIANFSEETSPQELADSGPFKNLTGDGDISAQKKFGDIYIFRNRAKLVMSYNTIPDLKDLSTGMLSRPLIVPFRKKIKEEEQDHDIKKKLFKELPGIFNFALQGWNRLEQQNHFTRSAKSELALEQIKQESCNVYQWVENYVDFDDDEQNTKRSSELYTNYRGRERYAYSIAHFGKKLNNHPEMKKRRIHKRNGTNYWGVEMR